MDGGGEAEKLQKLYFRSNLTPFFGAIFPFFGGRTVEGNFASFPHFWGISGPEAFRDL